MKKIRVRIPATTANFGSGFDCVGAALKLYNEIEVMQLNKTAGKQLSIEVYGEGKGNLPTNERNIVWKAMKKIFDNTNTPLANYHLRLINNIPLARGLGSSSATRIGGLVAANYLTGNKLSMNEIVNIAAELEGHPDNVVPAIFGGFCISYKTDKKIQYLKLNIPKNLVAVLCIPEFEVSTIKARRILPNRIPLKDAVFNSSRVALLIAAILEKKYELLSSAMEDRIHQTYRARLIPGMEKVFQSAKKQGAYGVALSGSGSTILAICNKEVANIVGKAMQNTFLKENIKSQYKICNFDNNGVKII